MRFRTWFCRMDRSIAPPRPDEIVITWVDPEDGTPNFSFSTAGYEIHYDEGGNPVENSKLTSRAAVPKPLSKLRRSPVCG